MDVIDEITKGREDALDSYDTELRRTSAETAGETDDSERGVYRMRVEDIMREFSWAAFYALNMSKSQTGEFGAFGREGTPPLGCLTFRVGMLVPGIINIVSSHRNISKVSSCG